MIDPKEEIKRIKASLDNLDASHDRVKDLITEIEKMLASEHIATQGFVLADLIARYMLTIPTQHREAIGGLLLSTIESLKDVEKKRDPIWQ